ncbi:MAG: rod shape-determining protein MreC [Patescibacteria group bacterium]
MFKKGTRQIFVFIAVIGLLIFLHFIKILSPIENIIIRIVNPLASGIYSVSSDLRLVYNEQTDKRDLLVIMKELEQKVNQLTQENVRLKILEEENEKLRQHLKFLTQNKFNYVLANIISQNAFVDFNEGGQTVLIDKGSKDGLKAGLGAVNSQGVIVGKIIKVKDNLSEISLTTNNNCRLAVAIQSQSSSGTNEVRKTIGIAEGELGLTIKINFIPQTEKINIGDIVATSGLESYIPQGLVIGKIIYIDSDSNEVWQSATIEPSADLKDLAIVSIIVP